MSTIFETLANTSADYLHSQSLDAERAEAIRAAILKQWKERDEPRAKHLAETTGIGRYKMVFEYKPQLEKDEFEQLLPEELKNVPSDKGSVFVWWGAHDPSKYEIHLNFETQRNLRLNELKAVQEKEEKAGGKIDPLDYGGDPPTGTDSDSEDEGVPFQSWDTSITYTRCPKGYHFIDDEGHISPNKKHGGSGKKRNKKREREDDKTDAEKDAENRQAILDDYAKDEATVAEGVAAKRMRVESLKTLTALQTMYASLSSVTNGKKWTEHANDDQASLALAWEKALLNDITHDAHDAFDVGIKCAEEADARSAAVLEKCKDGPPSAAQRSAAAIAALAPEA